MSRSLKPCPKCGVRVDARPQNFDSHVNLCDGVARSYSQRKYQQGKMRNAGYRKKGWSGYEI